jgi:hypothetical protein
MRVTRAAVWAPAGVVAILAEARADGLPIAVSPAPPSAASPLPTASPLPGASAAPGATEEVVARGVRVRRDVTSVRVTAEEGARTAGTEGDPVKVIEDLPGVARGAFGATPLVLWGASPADSRSYVDGVEIPSLFHGSALRSTIGADFVRDVTLTPGAYGADFGRALGGIVRVETRDLLREGAHAHVAVAADALDGSAFAAAAIGDRVRVGAAGRYGWIDPLLRAARVPDVDVFYAIPRYADYQAKLEADLGDAERLDVVFLGSRDDLAESVPDADPARIRTQTTRATYERLYARYRRTFEDGSAIDVVPWVGHDTNVLEDAFGGSPATLDVTTFRAGVRASSLSRPARWAAVTLGADVSAARASLARSGSLEIPPREGDLSVFGQPPGPDAGNDTWNVGSVDVAPFAAVDVEAGPLVVSPSLRFDAFVTTTSRRTPRIGQTPAVGSSRLDGELEPRATARLRVAPRLALVASAGIYSQPPAPEDLSAVFGNPTLGPERAEHATLGESAILAPGLTADLTAFYKWMDGLAVRNPAPTPALAQALLPIGVGRSYGVQLLLRQRPWRGFSGWVSYTIARSERRDRPGAAYRLFDYDQPHVAAIVAEKQIGAWTFGARFRFAVGLPRTPVVSAFYDAKDDAYDPVFGAQNGTRLPAFWQLDLRIDRAFALGRLARADVYVEGLNVTQHANAEEYAYSADYGRRGVVTGLPLVASIGARVEM